MRLLHIQDDGDIHLVEFVGDDIPSYAILSHTWGPDAEEVTYRDLLEGTGKNKDGYRKIYFCREKAQRLGLHYFWVDTCCIDKSSSAELSEAINSMFRWYSEAVVCFVYLADVHYARDSLSPQPHWKPAFRCSRWFTRGWTLQELLAPSFLVFYSAEGERLGNRLSLLKVLCDATGLPVQALTESNLAQFTIIERLSWADKRSTKRGEDAAYSLFGIFDIHLPIIYGEGKRKALLRLRREAEDTSTLELEPYDKPLVPSALTLPGPSAIIYNSKIYCFYKYGNENGHLWYEVSHGHMWQNGFKVPDARMSSGPSSVVYNNSIYCFYEGGRRSGELWYNVFDGRTWTRGKRCGNVTLTSAPSAVVYNNKIYCFYQHSEKSGQLWYSVINGKHWAGEYKVANAEISLGPTAIIHDNKIYCFHQGLNENCQLWYNVFDGSNWRGENQLPMTSFSSLSSAITYDNKVYCFYRGRNRVHEVRCGIIDGTDLIDDNIWIDLDGSLLGPSVLVHKSKLYLIYQDDNRIDLRIKPTTAIGWSERLKDGWRKL